ncbi:hypothetical protein GS876_10345 [Rhodococcus hoagii]|nr:hypothetical protein [Prescottella equi]NKT31584.1 hypothetical protein [Prescottella equi]NKT39264.1 hypothetical protein [Prescottella equi]NKT72940.1 hypothetical protein [Prescottella equi]NKT75892.1 hypothetical protein [Prescottella equi]
MAGRYRLSQEQVKTIMRNKALQQRLQDVGRGVMGRGQQITNHEGGSAEITLESGIRPGGRAFTNVVSSSAAEEYGNSKTKRRRALGRAVRER